MRFACFAYETELTVYLPSARIWRTWPDWNPQIARKHLRAVPLKLQVRRRDRCACYGAEQRNHGH